MVSTIINQKEYLKKYLAIGKVPGEKKKKKKLKGIQNRITIIDDDVVEEDSSKTITSEEALRIDEDAPQIVAIIDERPPSLRVDDKTKNPLWRPIGTVNHVNISKPTEDTPQKIKHEEEKIKEVKRRHKSEEKRTMKVEKTLDGKTAGLQSAQQLVEESKEIREREDQLFKNLSKDVSGENAPTVIRDRKTGKIRDFQEEEERKRKKLEEEEKNKEKYAKWGRGLAQVENREQQIQEELYEMSKPLARYADDEDLERYLKEQEREGDPMLAYLRSKKRKKAAKAGITEKPQFEGQFMPNRFGIKPGHRWDGVDRSNGYEKRWFEVQNAKRAQQEDTYKWSTEDM